MMHMTFYWSKEVTLLVNTWHTRSWGSYSLTLLACFIASALYQFLEHSRVRLKLSLQASSSTNDSANPSLMAPFLRSKIIGSGNDQTERRFRRAAEGVLFGVNSAIGYLLMLAVMSFNGGVFISIVCGLTAGYSAFRGSGEGDLASVAVDNPCACS